MGTIKVGCCPSAVHASVFTVSVTVALAWHDNVRSRPCVPANEECPASLSHLNVDVIGGKMMVYLATPLRPALQLTSASPLPLHTESLTHPHGSCTVYCFAEEQYNPLQALEEPQQPYQADPHQGDPMGSGSAYDDYTHPEILPGADGIAPNETLYVQNLPQDVTKRELAHIFRPFLGFTVSFVSAGCRCCSGHLARRAGHAPKVAARCVRRRQDQGKSLALNLSHAGMQSCQHASTAAVRSVGDHKTWQTGVHHSTYAAAGANAM